MTKSPDREDPSGQDFTSPRSAEQRGSSILDEQGQQIAQQLYDLALSRGGSVRDDSVEVTIVTVTGRKKRAQSMEVFVDGNGGIETRFRRGRRGWQDDGSHGQSGVFGEGSIMQSEEFHPTTEQRRETLRNAAQRFLPSQPQL